MYLKNILFKIYLTPPVSIGSSKLQVAPYYGFNFKLCNSKVEVFFLFFGRYIR